MTGQTIAHYKVTSKLGQGGMGAVYRATDTKLDREVAIKVLPESFAQDKERLARFEREAKVLAALNHPNIAGIFGIEQSGDSLALVLELVEGEDLSERLKRGRLPVEEALDICRQIAEALEAAHEKGIIHRDLKPGNVKLTADGKVKVLDFGLAKALVTDSSATAATDSMSPTFTADFTLPGTLLGTAGYMSPEQARGRAVDKRSDIWSFGCVMYECLTGKRTFQGEDVADTLAAIIRSEPNWSVLPENLPATIQLLLRKCLAKDRKRRLHDIADARVDLEQAVADPSSSFIRLGEGALREAKAISGRKHLRATTAALAVMTLVLTAVWLRERNRNRALEGAFAEASQSRSAATKQAEDVAQRYSRIRKIELVQRGLPAEDTEIREAVISPDGRKLVLGTRTGLWIRHLDESFDVIRIQGSDSRSRKPFWSSDSSEIGYFAALQEIRKTRLNGTTSELVTSIPKEGLGNRRPDQPTDSAGAAWLEDGRIVYTTGSSGLYSVPGKGGESRLVLEVAEDEQDYHNVSALPGGRGVVFAVHPKAGSGFPVAVWDGKSAKRILVESLGSNYEDPVYSPSGHLIYGRLDRLAGGNPGLWAVPFDLDRLESGDPFPIFEDAGSPSVSADGTLAYVVGNRTRGMFVLRSRQMVWVGQDGAVLEPIGSPKLGLSSAELSADGTRALARIIGNQSFRNSQLWVYSVARGSAFPLRDNAAGAHWLSDHDEILFTDIGEMSAPKVSRMSLNDPASSEILVTNAFLQSLSANGRYIVAASVGRRVPMYADLTLGGSLEWSSFPIQLHESAWGIRLSPDGRYLAYSSRESGEDEIYVVSFPAIQGKKMVSLGGGESPKWSRDGRTLFFVKGRSMMSVSVAAEPELEISLAKELFKIPESITFLINGSWDVAPDGRRFVMLQDVEEANSSRKVGTQAAQEAPPIPTLFLIENWHREFK